ncbi:MAG: ribonuclease Z [Ruminococcaceae bacterium]|nr:ribonuclease Z [Oscillospiraceae bacterium]
MKIVFFGTSHGVPEPNRRCSSTMIETGGARYFIDMGTQSIEQLITRGIRPETIKACFITHMHGDHTNGLISFIDLCSWYFKDADPEFYLPGNTDKSVEAIRNWISCVGQEMRAFKFGHVDDGFVYEDESIRLTAFRTKHTDASFSYLLEAEGKRVYFSGDLRSPLYLDSPLADIPVQEFDKGLDLAILELAHFDAPDKYYSLLKDKANIKAVCINHYSNIHLQSAFELIKKLPEQKIFLATDGLELEI